MASKNNTNIPASAVEQLFLERPRVHNLLAKALEYYIVVISAGEGYGKTYAVSSFLQNRSETTAWIVSSKRDNVPWRFWESYSNAMGLCKPQTGKELREIGFPETAQQFDKWIEINQREFSLPGKYIIVRDDCHCIESRVVLDFIERALSSPIINHTLILISRNEPTLNIAPALSKGWLTRINAEELLFTWDETAAYFKMRHIALSDREITAIHQDTEGWPLALGLLATELEKDGAAYSRRILEKGGFRALEDNVFAAVPEELQRYLVKLSLFEQWPVELLQQTSAVLSEPYGFSAKLPAEMEKLGALIRYDYYLHGYQIHEVFLDYLREKQRELPKEEIQAICAIAARWCLENNLRMDAAINFERAGDYAGLAAIVDSFPRLIPRSAVPLLMDIIERLIQIEDGDETDGNYIYLRYVVKGRLFVSLFHFDEAIAVFKESIRRFELLPPSPSAFRVLAEAWNYMGLIHLFRYRFGATEDYKICFKHAEDYYRRHPWPLSGFMTICTVSTYPCQVGPHIGEGEFARRVHSFSSSMDTWADSLSGYFSGLDDLARAEFAYYQGDLNAAEQFARSAIIKAREQNQYEVEHRALFFLMRINLHRGGVEELLAAWKQMDPLLEVAEYTNRYAVNDVISGWMYTQLKEQHKTPSWLRGRFETIELYSIAHNFEAMIKAKYLYAERQFDSVVSFLNLEKHKTGLRTYLLGMLEMDSLKAAALCQLGEEAEAAALLETSYRKAILNSLTMPFIELGYDMRPLAAAALSAGSAISPSWLEDIRSRASAYGKNLFAIAEQFRSQNQDGAGGTKIFLTSRERAVLRGLSQGLTREEIASGIGQSLSSVKSLISSACEKLGAVNRADAVRIASLMGILDNESSRPEGRGIL
jgi:LuxR family maltose regulon positive regulatory protein